MKKILALLTVVAVMLSCTAVFAETVFEHVGDRYTVTYNGTADRMYGFVVIAPTITGEGEEKSVTYNVSNISNSNLLYIDQQTADSNGTVTFSNFMLKDGYKNTTDENGYYGKVFIGGDGDAATLLGYISSEEKAGVTVSGVITAVKPAGVENVNLNVATVNLKNVTGETVQTATADANGNYVFETVPAGTYSIEFVKPAYCTYTYTDVVVEEEMTINVDISRLVGDIDEFKSNDIGYDDLMVLLGAYGEKGNDLNADLDRTGDIGFDDLMILLGNYGSVGQSTPYSK